jgi:hypothetical protein
MPCKLVCTLALRLPLLLSVLKLIPPALLLAALLSSPTLLLLLPGPLASGCVPFR